MKLSKTNRLCLALVILLYVCVLAAYAFMPATLPMHWNTAGQIDRYAPKAIALFLIPVLATVIFVSNYLKGKDDDGQKAYNERKSVFAIIVMYIVQAFVIISGFRMGK